MAKIADDYRLLLKNLGYFNLFPEKRDVRKYLYTPRSSVTRAWENVAASMKTATTEFRQHYEAKKDGGQNLGQDGQKEG